MSSSEVALWAASGAMALTGRPDGPPLVGPGRPATFVRDHLAALGLSRPGLLGERAAHAGLVRNAPWSVGGAMRMVPTRDGHIALSLPREADLDLVPALVGRELDANPWDAVTAWAAEQVTTEAAERIHLLGLAGGSVPAVPSAVPPVCWDTTVRPPLDRRPLVLDLTALWAGPLCTRLLLEMGARIVKVESMSRPDGTRRGAAGFFRLLNDGKEHVTLDLPRDVTTLRTMATAADLVVESSRPRALRQMGLLAEDVVADGTSWLSITARGRASDAIGFGDDVAACAGAVIVDDGDLLPVGDALADPLTGVLAAVAATDVLHSDAPRLLEISMLDVTRAAVSGPAEEHEVVRHGDGWCVVTADGPLPVARPAALS